MGVVKNLAGKSVEELEAAGREKLASCPQEAVLLQLPPLPAVTPPPRLPPPRRRRRKSRRRKMTTWDSDSSTRNPTPRDLLYPDCCIPWVSLLARPAGYLLLYSIYAE